MDRICFDGAYRALRLAWVAGTLAATLACAGASGPPGWVNGEAPEQFPERRFMSALATGQSLSAAQTAAKAELSRVFSAKLESEIRLVEGETTEGDRSVQRSELLDDTRIRADFQLEGVDVPLHWRDPKTGEIWALAVLERNKECLRVRAEGRDLETELDAYRRESRASRNPLLALRAAIHAVEVGVALDGLQGRSRVLGMQCLDQRSVSTGQLKSEAIERLRQLSFVVRTHDLDPRTGAELGPLPQLREEIAGNLSDLGFQVGPVDGARVVPIEAHMRLSRVARGTDWVEYRYEGAAEVGSPVPGEPATIVVETSGAESHPEPASARLRARRAGERALAHQLDQRIRAFLLETTEAR